MFIYNIINIEGPLRANIERESMERLPDANDSAIHWWGGLRTSRIGVDKKNHARAKPSHGMARVHTHIYTAYIYFSPKNVVY